MSNFVRIAFLIGAAALVSACSKNYSAYALTSTGSIIEFQTNTPATISNSVTVSGLNTGETIVQINYQPSTGTLYCITNDGYLCTVDPTSGEASLVASTPFTETLGNGGNTVTLSQPQIGFDPVGGDLRVIATGYNLLVNPDGGLDAVETPVAYSSGDTNNGKTPNLVGIAYSNPVAGATDTTLYALDAETSSLVQIGDANVSNPDSPNGGVLSTVGSLGLAFSTTTGFTIDQASDTGYASLQDGSGATLYTVDLSSGALTSQGSIGDGTETIISLVIVPGD